MFISALILRLRLMLLTKLSYIVFITRQSYQREILRWFWNEIYIAIRWDAARWCATSICRKRYSLVLLAVYDYKRLDSSLYFIIANFHTELKPQVNDKKDKKSPEFTQYTTLN